MILKMIAAGSLAIAAAAQQHEIGLSLGGVLPSERSAATARLDLGSGRAWQANYGYRLASRDKWALLSEVHFLASPLREVTSANRGATRDFASLYLIPGFRVKLIPNARISPWVSGGGGWALYEQSLLTLDGRSNPAPRLTHRGAIQFGGGVDIRAWRLLSLRAEIRDFYSGSPAFNAPARGGQHNVVAGGGIVLRFGE